MNSTLLFGRSYRSNFFWCKKLRSHLGSKRGKPCLSLFFHFLEFIFDEIGELRIPVYYSREMKFLIGGKD